MHRDAGNQRASTGARKDGATLAKDADWTGTASIEEGCPSREIPRMGEKITISPVPKCFSAAGVDRRKSATACAFWTVDEDAKARWCGADFFHCPARETRLA